MGVSTSGDMAIIDRQTPDQAYFNALTPMMVAA